MTILQNEVFLNTLSQIGVGLGKASELLACKYDNFLLFSLGSSLKNFGAASYNFTVEQLLNKGNFAITSIIGAGLRSTATFLDDLLIHYNLFENHHLTKVSDALYTGFLITNGDNLFNTKSIFNVNKLGTTVLWTGGLLLGSWIMEAADTIEMERNIAQEAYKTANKLDSLTASHLEIDLYTSIAFSSFNQTLRQFLSDNGFDPGAPLTLGLNAITGLAIGKDSSEDFKSSLKEKLLESGFLSNNIKVQEILNKDPAKLEKLFTNIASAKHLISVLPLKYQTSTLGDHIAASKSYGLLYKSLNNLFNFYKIDNLSGFLQKHQDKDMKQDAFIDTLQKKEFHKTVAILEHKLKLSDTNSFWEFGKKIVTNLLPIAIESTIAAYISHGEYGKNNSLFWDDKKFLGNKHFGDQLLVNSNQIKNLFDEFLGHPIALEDLDLLIDLIETQY